MKTQWFTLISEAVPLTVAHSCLLGSQKLFLHPLKLFLHPPKIISTPPTPTPSFALMLSVPLPSFFAQFFQHSPTFKKKTKNVVNTIGIYFGSIEILFQCLIQIPGTRGKSGNKKDKQKVDIGIDPVLDAITYLTQLLQLRKENPAEYTLKADNGPQQKGLMRFQMMVRKKLFSVEY